MDRNEKKLIAVERAKFRLAQRLEAIDWEEDVLLPMREEYKRELGSAVKVDYALVADTTESDEEQPTEAGS